MNDVAYRINTALPVKKYGTIVTNVGDPAILGASGFAQVYNQMTVTVPNESPAGTGLRDRFDDPTYYTA